MTIITFTFPLILKDKECLICNSHTRIYIQINFTLKSHCHGNQPPRCHYYLNVGHISSRNYTKSTDTHSFLSYSSFHPRHIKQSIICSQFLCYKCICSNDKIFLSDPSKLFKYFLSRQYPFSDIHHKLNKVKLIGRHKLLSHTAHTKYLSNH